MLILLGSVVTMAAFSSDLGFHIYDFIHILPKFACLAMHMMVALYIRTPLGSSLFTCCLEDAGESLGTKSGEILSRD